MAIANTTTLHKPEMAHVSPDKLLFDPDNPRFGEGLMNKTQDQIQKILLGDPHYASELVDSLIENGFIEYEPLVVRKEGDHYKVIEGNRRLAAVKEIRAKLAQYPNRKSDLNEIPVLVFPQTHDAQHRNEMRIYLGLRHLFGFREWPPLSKAQFLERESKQAGGLEKVLQEVRLSKTQARRFLVPYRLLQSAHIQIPHGEDFWVLAEALNRSGVKEYLELEVDPKTLDIVNFNKENLTHILDDLYGPKISGKRDPEKRKVRDTRELSVYAKVLASPKPRAVLRGGKDLGVAEVYLGTLEQSLTRLSSLVAKIRLLINKVAPSTDKDEHADELRNSFKQLETATHKFLKYKKNA